MARNFAQTLGQVLVSDSLETQGEERAAEKARIEKQKHKLNGVQYLMLAARLIKDFDYPWFESATNPRPDQHMVRLLFNTYFFEMFGCISKKDAWQLIGVADIKTARKYVQRAEEAGLIESFRSDEDKRVELLAPTARLRDLVETELLLMSDRLRRLMGKLLKDGLPETGAPVLLLAEHGPTTKQEADTSATGKRASSGRKGKQKIPKRAVRK
jgi:hypothetical protein